MRVITVITLYNKWHDRKMFLIDRVFYYEKLIFIVYILCLLSCSKIGLCLGFLSMVSVILINICLFKNVFFSKMDKRFDKLLNSLMYGK